MDMSIVPVTHLQLSSLTRPQSDIQRLVLNQMPAISGKQPVNSRRVTVEMR